METPQLSSKFIRKYMRLARQIGEDNDACYSRQIGTVIVKVSEKTSRIVGTGYNGPAPCTPHTDSHSYLRDYFWPLLTSDDKESLRLTLGIFRKDYPEITDTQFDKYCAMQFAGHYNDKKICPRRLLKCGPGERSELCTCGHSERHAITNTACDLDGALMFCWCCIPCIQCSDSIIQAGIVEVHCHEGPEYQKGSLWMLESAGVNVYQYDPKEFA